MTSFFGAYLGREVQLSGSAKRISPSVIRIPRPEHRERVGAALADPDQVRCSPRFGAAKLFSRWLPDARGGKHVVVVVVSAGEDGRLGSLRLTLPGGLLKRGRWARRYLAIRVRPP